MSQVTAIQRDGLDREKWREVPSVPSLAADEEDNDPLEVGSDFHTSYNFRLALVAGYILVKFEK